MKEFDEALAILNNHQKLAWGKREERMKSIKSQYAFFRMQKSEFEEAMGLFVEAEVDPVVVIGIFPNLLDAETRARLIYPEGFEVERIDFNYHAYESLIRYLTGVRTRLHAATRASMDETLAKSARRDSRIRTSHAPNLLTVVDTVLLKIYLKENPALVGPLLRVTNDCDGVETPELLRRHGKWTELLDYFYGKERHRDAIVQIQQ